MDHSSNNPYQRNDIRVGGRRISSAGDLPEGVTVGFHDRSRGNRVSIAADGKFKNVVIDLGSAIDCTVSVGAIRVNFGGLRISFVLNSGRCSKGVFVSVGGGSVLNGGTHIIGPLTPGVGVHLGSDCLIASNVSIRGSSHHGLWDAETGELLNAEAGITIGDHVWIGSDVVVLNKAEIASGSVIAARSVVNKRFDVKNALLAGIPAAVRRRNVEWTHEFPVDNGASRRTV